MNLNKLIPKFQNPYANVRHEYSNLLERNRIKSSKMLSRKEPIKGKWITAQNTFKYNGRTIKSGLTYLISSKDNFVTIRDLEKEKKEIKEKENLSKGRNKQGTWFNKYDENLGLAYHDLGNGKRQYYNPNTKYRIGEKVVSQSDLKIAGRTIKKGLTYMVGSDGSVTIFDESPKENKTPSPKDSSKRDRSSRSGSSATKLVQRLTTTSEPFVPRSLESDKIGIKRELQSVPKEANTPLLPSMNNRSQWGNYWNSLDNLGKYDFMGQVASMDGGTDWSTLSLNDWNSYFNNYYNKPWDTSTKEGAEIFAGMNDYYKANRKKYGKTGLDSEDATHLNMLYNDYLRNDIWNNVLAVRKGKLDLNTYQGQYKGLIQSLANANEKSAKNYLFNLWNTENDVNTPQGRANFVANPKINNVGEPLKYIGGDYPHLNTNVDKGIVTLGNNEGPNYSGIFKTLNDYFVLNPLSNLGMNWMYGGNLNAPNATSFIHGVRELTPVPQQFDVASGFRRYLKENPISKKQGGLLPRVPMYRGGNKSNRYWKKNSGNKKKESNSKSNRNQYVRTVQVANRFGPGTSTLYIWGTPEMLARLSQTVVREDAANRLERSGNYRTAREIRKPKSKGAASPDTLKLALMDRLRKLKELGYYTGKIDGIWGDKSKAAEAAYLNDLAAQEAVKGLLIEVPEKIRPSYSSYLNDVRVPDHNSYETITDDKGNVISARGFNTPKFQMAINNILDNVPIPGINFSTNNPVATALADLQLSTINNAARAITGDDNLVILPGPKITQIPENQKEVLRQMILNNGNFNGSYSNNDYRRDYGTYTGGNRSFKERITGPKNKIEHSMGQFNYYTDVNGDVHVTDKYDWNVGSTSEDLGKYTTLRNIMGIVGTKSDAPLNLARVYDINLGNPFNW